MLTQLQRLLPPEKRVIILADRGFGKTDLAPKVVFLIARAC